MRAVVIAEVMERAGQRQALQPAPVTTTEQPPAPSWSDDVLPIPKASWDKMLDQLGNLHEAGQQLADARERAAKAETQVEFLRERVSDLVAQLEETKTAQAPLPFAGPPGTGKTMADEVKDSHDRWASDGEELLDQASPEARHFYERGAEQSNPDEPAPEPEPDKPDEAVLGGNVSYAESGTEDGSSTESP
jgi:hypothetical protein